MLVSFHFLFLLDFIFLEKITPTFSFFVFFTQSSFTRLEIGNEGYSYWREAIIGRKTSEADAKFQWDCQNSVKRVH